jgi:squalene-hopene/tetraprenyl-beta-curcumene cyclase
MSTLSRRTMLGRTLGAAGLVSLGTWQAKGYADEAADSPRLVDKALRFLRPRQGNDGSWSGAREPGITALVLTAMLRSGRVAPGEAAVTKGLGFLEHYIGPKGGLSEAPHSVYTTSVALMAFHEANRDGRYDRIIKGGQDFLKATQWDEGEGKSRDDPAYGGLGYGGGNSRPDLSNTSFFIEALRDTGLPPNDPALQKALIFVSRCQNLKSEFNDQPWAGKVNDGGFIYNPAAAGGSGGGGGRGKAARGGESPARGGGDGTIRSCAGMTYAGLKSMIYAGLSQDDPRIKAAITFIKNHYTLEENPGQGQRGLYYYYQTFAKALALLGKPTLVDTQGVEHNWRKDLVAALAKRQDAGGGWVNHDDRFMEGDPNIVTSYGLLALVSAREKT